MSKRCGPGKSCGGMKEGLFNPFFTGNYGGSSEESQEISFDSTVITLEADTYRINSRAVINQTLFGRSIYWENGKTYVLYRQSTSAENRAKPAIFYYDEKNSFTKHRVVGPYLSSYSDEHPHPVLIVKSNRMYVVQEQPHSTPLRVMKSRNNNDVTGGFDLQGFEIGNEICYPHLLDNGSGTALFYRIGTTGASQSPYVLRSVDTETWSGNGNNIVNVTDFTGYDRVYVGTPFNHYVNGWYYYEFTLRNDDTTNKWGDSYILKTQDHTTFYNIAGTLSKNVSSTAFTGTEFNNSCRVFDVSSNLLDGFKPCSAISPSGTFFSIRNDGAGQYKFIRVDTDGTVTTKNITIANQIGGQVNTQDGAFIQMIAWADNNVDIFVRRTVATKRKIWRYNSVDKGDNWTEVGDMFPTINEHFNYIGFPYNLHDIPVNRNSICIATQEDTNDSVNVKAYVKKFAIGSVQTEVADTYVAYSSITSEPEQPDFAFEIQAGKISNTGTTLTGLTDQSGNGRTVSIFGSPVIDNATTPTYVRFDGVNDRIEISTTGLTTRTKGTIYAVGRKTSGQTTTANFNLLTLTNTGSATEAVGFNLNNALNASWRIIRSGSTTPPAIQYQGTNNLIGNTFHVITYQAEQQKQYSVFVDGVPDDLTYVSGDRHGDGDFADAITVSHANRITLGALVRSSIAYTDGDLMAIYFYPSIHTREQVIRTTKMIQARLGL